jgi:hypothetical protein
MVVISSRIAASAAATTSLTASVSDEVLARHEMIYPTLRCRCRMSSGEDCLRQPYFLRVSFCTLQNFSSVGIQTLLLKLLDDFSQALGSSVSDGWMSNGVLQLHVRL